MKSPDGLLGTSEVLARERDATSSNSIFGRTGLAKTDLRMVAPSSGNGFLRALSTRDYELLRPHLASVELEQYAILFSADDKITQAPSVRLPDIFACVSLG